jgi:hypothetical protein
LSSEEKPLTEFDTTESGVNNDDNTKAATSAEPPTPLQSHIEESSLQRPGSEFPESRISELEDGTYKPRLCVESGVVEPTFATIAGRGGLGGPTTIENKQSVYETARACIDLPVVITGGGTGTPMGSGAIYGCLDDVALEEESVTVTLTELYHENGTANQDKKARTLGSYRLSVPAKLSDCKVAVAALSQWETGVIEFLNPRMRRFKEMREDRFNTFEALSPADRLNTPEYASQLEVVSEPFETYAIVPRGTLSEKQKPVLAVVVSNPNGGFYQLGIGIRKRDRVVEEVPLCYLSQSQNTPPTPNTAFTVGGRFASTKLEVTPIAHPPDPTVIAPDTEVLESPLPEPRLRTSLEEIDGIGHTSMSHIRDIVDDRVSAESVAHTLYGDGDHHDEEAIAKITGVIDALANKENIYRRLKSYSPEQNGD